MLKNDTKSQFKTKLLRPAKSEGDALWAFIILPKSASEKLPRRGRTTIEGTINTHSFQVTLEPDGQLSHWLRISKELMKAAGVTFGDVATFEIMSVAQEPEPEVPPDLQEALSAASEAHAVWNNTTTLARLDWIHWISSAKQLKTRNKRVNDACAMLASGKQRVCCFDPSGYYSKALSSPKAEN